MMPYDFVLDSLYPYHPIVKKMFGQYVLIIGDKIVFALRQNNKNPIDNGLWLATDFEHHESLKMEFSSLKTLTLYNIKKWLLLPENSDDFETTATEICNLVKKNDKRIGIIKNEQI